MYKNECHSKVFKNKVMLWHKIFFFDLWCVYRHWIFYKQQWARNHDIINRFFFFYWYRLLKYSNRWGLQRLFYFTILYFNLKPSSEVLISINKHRPSPIDSLEISRLLKCLHWTVRKGSFVTHRLRESTYRPETLRNRSGYILDSTSV